jgi:hypothetical protein
MREGLFAFDTFVLDGRVARHPSGMNPERGPIEGLLIDG